MPEACARRWWCASSEGSPCDCTGQLPKFLADWVGMGLDVSELPAWLGPRQFHRNVETIEPSGAFL